MGWFFSGVLLSTLLLVVWEITGLPYYLFTSGVCTGASILILMIIVKSETQ